MNPVKLGIIGCGIAARDLHWPALQELKDRFEIVVVCNHTEEKAREFSKLVGGVPYVLDYKKVLEMPDVEAVSIILPIELNYQVTKEAIEAGKHIIVEKPLTTNLADAEILVELEKGYQKVTMVAENFRYRKIFRRASEYMKENKIGKIYSVFWNNFMLLESDNKYAQTSWRINHKYPGGFVTDGGVHNIAALRDMFGDIIKLSSFTKSFNPGIGEIDSLSFQFATKSNVNGVINIFFSSNGYSENKMIILGKDGCICLVNDDTLTITKGENTVLIEKFENDMGYKEEFEEFYEAIRQGKTVRSSFSEAYSDLKVILEALI